MRCRARSQAHPVSERMRSANQSGRTPVRSKKPESLTRRLNPQLALSGAVELAEVHALPCTQHRLSVFDEERHARSDEAGLQVRIAVPFRVAEPGYVLGNV